MLFSFLNCNTQNLLNLCQCLVYLRVKRRTFLIVLGKEFCWWQDFFFFLWKLALVEIAVHIHQLPGGEAFGLFVTIGNDNLPAVVPPIDDGLAVLTPHGLGLGEVLVTFRHIQAIKPSVLGVKTFIRTLGFLIVEEKYIRGNAGIRSEDAAWQTNDSVKIKLAEQLLLNG